MYHKNVLLEPLRYCKAEKKSPPRCRHKIHQILQNCIWVVELAFDRKNLPSRPLSGWLGPTTHSASSYTLTTQSEDNKVLFLPFLKMGPLLQILLWKRYCFLKTKSPIHEVGAI
jgi:hypothetical protein